MSRSTHATSAGTAGRRTVRDATFDLFRRRGLTTMFGNPGSTEVPFLTDLPDDLHFVLSLHENSVIGMASGWALARDEPALALLHTTAGLGNAVGALATARATKAPLVVLVGQQDRRHLAYEPFLSGHLAGLAGDYPVAVEQPVRPQDVPAAIERAFHAAATARGPVLVIVPMDDWDAPCDDEREPAAATGRVLRPSAAGVEAADALAAFLAESVSPAIVVGAGADDAATWAALAQLSERLLAPVYQEAFGARAGFPQDHPHFAGLLPADRPGLRDRLAAHDTVLVVGAPAFRQSFYAPGRLAKQGTRIAVATADAEELYRSPADLAVLAPLASLCAAVAERVLQREGAAPAVPPPPSAPAPPAAGAALRSEHVLAALAERLPRDAVVVEEAPVDRPELNRRLLVREPMGLVSAAQGGLGFAVSGAAGIRMALPSRPVVAVIGDGAAVFGIQGLWAAAYYRVGVLYVVFSNGGYAIMDTLARLQGGAGPWPSFEGVDVAALARGFGCEARRITTHEELLTALDEVVPTLATRTAPLLLDVVVEPTRWS